MLSEFTLKSRILVVGCGFIGSWHARVLRQLDVTNLAVCDPNSDVRHALQRELTIAEGYADFHEALQHDFEAVFICTPPAYHVPQAKLALEAGCDVFTEKPLSDSLEGVDELIELADHQGRILMIGLPMRFRQGLLRVKQLIDEGAIGRLVSVRAMVAVHLPDSRPGVDYRKVYVSQPGCGVILDYLHEIDLVQWIVNAPAQQVFAFSGQLSQLEMEADDTSEVLVKFENDVIASIHLSVFQRVRRRQSEFAGTEGTIVIDLASVEQCSLQIYRAATGRWETEAFTRSRDDLLKAEDQAFLDCISTRTQPALDGREGKKSLQIALAAMASSEHGALIQL